MEKVPCKKERIQRMTAASRSVILNSMKRLTSITLTGAAILALCSGCGPSGITVVRPSVATALAAYRGPVATTDGILFACRTKKSADRVFLAGSFNNWQPDDPRYRMERQGDSLWTLTLELDPGRYLYKFVVDGHWLADEANTNLRPDGYGGTFSVTEAR